MSTNLEYRAGGRPAKLNEKKAKETFFLLEVQHENFVAAVTKLEMPAVTNARLK